jgi:hypothetical protein
MRGWRHRLEAALVLGKITLTAWHRRAKMMGTDTLVSFSYHIFNIQCTSEQQYRFTRQNNAITIHLVTNIHFTNPLATCRSGVPRTLLGGSSEVNCFKSSRQPVAPPNDQSSLRTSSQISSINRRYAISIISNAISRSSLSVGIRPAPKSGS